MKIRVVIDTENPGRFKGYDDATGEEMDIVSVHARFDGHPVPDVAIRWRDPATPHPTVTGGYFPGEEHEASTADRRREMIAARTNL